MSTATFNRRQPPAHNWDPYYNFYGSGKFKFHIYPDSNWNEKKWGERPYLGTVYADDEFYAAREAYSKGLAPVNCTFGLMALKTPLEYKDKR